MRNFSLPHRLPGGALGFFGHFHPFGLGHADRFARKTRPGLGFAPANHFLAFLVLDLHAAFDGGIELFQRDVGGLRYAFGGFFRRAGAASQQQQARGEQSDLEVFQLSSPNL